MGIKDSALYTQYISYWRTRIILWKQNIFLPIQDTIKETFDETLVFLYLLFPFSPIFSRLVCDTNKSICVASHPSDEKPRFVLLTDPPCFTAITVTGSVLITHCSHVLYISVELRLLAKLLITVQLRLFNIIVSIFTFWMNLVVLKGTLYTRTLLVKSNLISNPPPHLIEPRTNFNGLWFCLELELEVIQAPNIFLEPELSDIKFVYMESELGAFWLQLFLEPKLEPKCLRAKEAFFALKEHFNFTH